VEPLFLKTNNIMVDISIIQQLGLTDDQVHKIVLEWYTNGMCPCIFQNEEGEDLEEYLEQ